MASKFKKSPHYQEIVNKFEERLPDINQGMLSVSKFYRDYVKDKVPYLSRSGFYNWAVRYKGEDGMMLQSGGDLPKDLKETNDQMNQMMLRVQRGEVSPSEISEEADNLARNIRLWARYIMHEKIAELVKKPTMIRRMTYNQVLKLYQIIRKEEDKERELNLKQQTSNREDALAIFRIGIASGNIDVEDLDTLMQKVQERRNKNKLDKQDEKRQQEEDEEMEVRPSDSGQTDGQTNSQGISGAVSSAD